MPLPPSYTVVDLGAPQGFDGDNIMPIVEGIDDASQVCASNYVVPIFPPQYLAYVYRGGTWFGIQPLSTIAQISPTDINGQATGSSAIDTNTSHAFRSPGGLSQDLGTLPGDVNSVGTAANADGQVVGYSCGQPCTTFHPFVWDSTSGMNPLPIASGTKPHPTGLTRHDPVVTSFFYVAGYDETETVFIYTNGVPPTTTRIGTHGAGTRTGGMNGAADIVGYSNSGPFWVPQAFSQGATIMDLPLPDQYGSGTAARINDLRHAVGSALFGNQKHAIAYGADELTPTVVDLNNRIPSGTGFILLETAAGINNNDQIVGVGKVSDVRRHVFLLNPSQDTVVNETQQRLAQLRELLTFNFFVVAELVPTVSSFLGSPLFAFGYSLYEAAMAFIHIWTLKNAQAAAFDAQFPTVWTPPPPPLFTFPQLQDDPSFPSGFAAATNAANDHAAQAILYMSAVRATLNRMEGAFLMGDEARYGTQQQALNGISGSPGFLQTTQQRLLDYAAALMGIGRDFAGTSVDITPSQSDVASFQQDLQAQGFAALPQQEQVLFSQFGLTQTDFSLALNDLVSVDPGSVAIPWSTALTQMISGHYSIMDIADLYYPLT